MSWIKWLETRNLVTAAPAETVSVAVERMVARRVGSVLVVQDRELYGIFSERDVLTRVLGPGRDPATTPLAEVATRDVKTVPEDADLSECARLVRDYKVRHVPVVGEDGRPVGIISVRDFLDHVMGELEGLIQNSYREKRLEQLVDPYEIVDERLGEHG